MQYQRETCSGCGQPVHQSTNRANQFAYRVELIRCHGCAARERAAKKYSENDDNDTSGLMVQFTKTPGGIDG